MNKDEKYIQEQDIKDHSIVTIDEAIKEAEHKQAEKDFIDVVEMLTKTTKKQEVRLSTLLLSSGIDYIYFMDVV